MEMVVVMKLAIFPNVHSRKIVFLQDLDPIKCIATRKCAFGWAIENVVGLQVLNLSIKL